MREAIYHATHFTPKDGTVTFISASKIGVSIAGLTIDDNNIIVLVIMYKHIGGQWRIIRNGIEGILIATANEIEILDFVDSFVATDEFRVYIKNTTVSLGNVTVTGGNMEVLEENSAAMLAKLSDLNITSGDVTETNSAAILSALAGISGGGNPLDLYVNTKTEDLGSVIYLGFEKPNSTKWYMLKYDGTSFLYANSVSNAVLFATAWTNRATLSPTYSGLQTLTF